MKLGNLIDSARRVLVSDFDGTMTRHDFFELARAELVPPGGRDYWAEHQAGRLTNFEALAGIFASIRGDESAVMEVARRCELDPRLAEGLARLRAAGWEVVVVSAGCRWYIDRLLAERGIELGVIANPGELLPGGGLVMRQPTGAPYHAVATGVDKAFVVATLQAAGIDVAFAGDGRPDRKAAGLVAAARRYARRDLAAELSADGESFVPFERWYQVVEHLLHGA